MQWEEFAVFGDMGELEHVCELFETAAEESVVDLSSLVGNQSHLIKRLENQDTESRALLEIERPGLYDRTWMAGLIRQLYVVLDELAEKPYLLRGELPGLLLSFHKVQIAAHEIYDPSHRSALVAKAMIDGMKIGADEAKDARSEQSREAVRSRLDQKAKAAFMAWAVKELAAGKSANTVNELQAMDGFDPAWSAAVRDQKTLRGWAGEAGFKFRTGRPKKNK